MESPSPSDFFSLFGLAREHAIDRDALERAYLEAAKRWHPDRFAGATTAEQRTALERSSALNEGYRVLRDPVRRAEYLVKLDGIDLDSSDDQGGAPKPDAGFLMEMIERRELLEQDDPPGADALEELRDQVADEEEQRLAAAVAALRAREPRRAAAELVARRYLQRLLDEVDVALEGV